MNAAKRGDMRLVRALQLLRLGLSLSAISYALRLIATPGSLAAFGSFFCCVGGSLLIWIGFLEHQYLLRERQDLIRAEKSTDSDSMAGIPAEAGMPCLTTSTHQVLWNAATEARQRRQGCVDTDHLLLGLLTVPGSAGGHVLDRLGIKRENIRLALTQPPATGIQVAPARSAAEDPPLTVRARRVFTLAAQEAHRFDKTAVGTEHLLLGLVLAGTGYAASVLFREGATVDGIRDEILKDHSRV